MPAHKMRPLETEAEVRKHEQDVKKRQAENATRFRWPDTVLWEEREVKVSSKNPNFAMCMLGASQMNRKVYMPKDVYLRWLARQ